MDRLVTAFGLLILGGGTSLAAGQTNSVFLAVFSIIINLVAMYHFVQFLRRVDDE